MITCPECMGRGQYSALVMFSDGCRPASMPCSRCKGDGKVSPAMTDWIAMGGRLRRARQERDLSLREEAARLGISVVELSQMERGAIKPIDYEAERERLKEVTDGRTGA